MMNSLICESNYDRIFLSEVIRKYFIPNYEPHEVKTTELSGLQEAIRCKITKIIIYGDNGKLTISDLIIPRLVLEIVGIRPDNFSFIVILDSDGELDTERLKKVKGNIDQFLQAKRRTNYNHSVDEQNVCILLSSNNDTRYIVKFRFFLIPVSFERQLITKAVENCRSVISQNRRKHLQDMDPHIALNEIAKALKISKEELIRKSVNENWFGNEDWFKKMISMISESFSHPLCITP